MERRLSFAGPVRVQLWTHHGPYTLRGWVWCTTANDKIINICNILKHNTKSSVVFACLLAIGRDGTWRAAGDSRRAVDAADDAPISQYCNRNIAEAVKLIAV